MTGTCERCGEKASSKKDRYCKRCSKAVLRELREAGYLPEIFPTSHTYRTTDHKENTYETKHGTGHG